MKLLDNILARFGFVNRDVVQRYGKRLYKAAQVDRMTSFMGNVNTQINQDIKTGNKIVRPRARDLKKNNDHAKNFDRRTKVNVIGPEGIKLQSVVKLPDGSLDEKANNLAEEKWRKWCERDFCTMSGTHHFTTITRQLWGSFKTDGEIFVRFIYPKSSVNPFGFSLELIDPEDVDESINKDLGNGKAIIMGIEFNEWYKPVAYHIKKRSLKASLQNYYHTGENETVRVPAEQILHVYDPDYIKQVRGISHYVHSLLRLKKVEAYEDASLDKAIGTSRTFGSWEEKLNDAQDYQSEDRDENDNPILNLQSGSIINAPHGKSLQIFDPDFPHEQFGPFIEVNVRAFYAAQGMDYAVATGHLSQANFSSLKSGRVDEQDQFLADQNFFITEFMNIIYKEWLLRSMMTGEVNLPISKFDHYYKPSFRGRRWKQLEPYKEAMANKLNRELNHTSDSDIISDKGGDINEVYAQIAHDKKLREKHGIKETETKPAVPKNNDEDEVDSTDDKQEKKILQIL